MLFLDKFIKILCQVLTVACVIRALLSGFALSPGNPVIVVLFQITEPVLAPLRRLIPRTGNLDISPMVAILLLQLIVYLIP